MRRSPRNLRIAYVTTNAILLGEKIDVLFEAGLRSATVGFYGNETTYDGYADRSGSFERLERSIATVRERYAKDFRLQINFLLCRPSCNRDAVGAALRFAEKYETRVQIDLVHYSLPYFTEGPDRELQFRPSDRDILEAVVDELLEFRQRRPDLYSEPLASIRSIPDWALKGPNMRVPCNAYRMMWVGADGTVQLCYVTFKLGNLHQQRLREMLFTAEHKAAARGAFLLDCPNCHCQRFERIQTDKTSLRPYSA
jgi:molybdenum cofactor biosynthesis enzyme MoaA